MIKQRVKRKFKQFTAGVLSVAMMLTITPVQVIGDNEYAETQISEITTVSETEIVTEPIETEPVVSEAPVIETTVSETTAIEEIVSEIVAETTIEPYENIVAPINLTYTDINDSSVTVAL